MALREATQKATYRFQRAAYFERPLATIDTLEALTVRVVEPVCALAQAIQEL